MKMMIEIDGYIVFKVNNYNMEDGESFVYAREVRIKVKIGSELKKL